MYKIVYRLFNNPLTVTEYGFNHYILERCRAILEDEEIENIEIFPLVKCWENFIKCLKNYCKIS